MCYTLSDCGMVLRLRFTYKIYVYMYRIGEEQKIIGTR